MSKYDDFDLDIMKNSSIVNDASSNKTRVECYTVTACTCNDFCVSLMDICVPSQECTEICNQTLSACHSYCGSACRR